MAAFEYRALDSTGRHRKGVITADTSRSARRELRRARLTPLRVETAKSSDSGFNLDDIRMRRSGVSAKELAVMTRQLATLVSSTAPVEQALQIVAAETGGTQLKRALLTVKSRVTEGRRLSAAMAEQPKIFGSFFTSLIAAGEGTGNLGLVLERLAEHLEKARQLRSKVRTALIYPAALSLVAVTVISLLMTFVVPKVAAQFDSLGQELPTITQMMIAVSDGIRSYGVLILALCALSVLLFARSLKNASFRKRIDSILLRIPLVGGLIKSLNAVHLARTLSTLVASGAPIVEGLIAAKQTTSNVVMRDALAEIITRVQEGESVSTSLRKSDVFPPLVGYMASVGETTGQLPQMLNKAADYLESEYQTTTDTALSLLEPAIIVLMGVIVAVIVLSILMPVLQLNTTALM